MLPIENTAAMTERQESGLLRQIADVALLCDRLNQAVLCLMERYGEEVEWQPAARAAQQAAFTLKCELIRCYFQGRIDAAGWEFDNNRRPPAHPSKRPAG